MLSAVGFRANHKYKNDPKTFSFYGTINKKKVLLAERKNMLFDGDEENIYRVTCAPLKVTEIEF